MYYLTRKTRRKYNSFPKALTCHFCDPEQYKNTLISEREHCIVIANRTFYDQWEMSKVLTHYMVIPKRHILHLKELTSQEREDIMDVIAEYEGEGYEIYARSQINITRSVPHQHTHLIKTNHKPRRFMVFIRRPWILWIFG